MSDEDVQEEILRLLTILVRLKIGNQAQTIQELNRAGFGPSRIAELLGTSPGTVNVALARSKRQRKKPTQTQ